MTSELEISKYREGLAQFIQSCQGDLTPITSSRVVKAREKLCKLTRVQFIDLSINVYDELQRRSLDSEVAPKHLEPQVGYHPKRNQARQKLAALPASRFKDLVNDVLFEIDNRLDDGSLVTKKRTDNPMGLHINIPEANSGESTILRETPLNNAFSPLEAETPTQMKSTTLIPNKSELTWSTDEEDNVRDSASQLGHAEVIGVAGSIDGAAAGANARSLSNPLLRSPSKKVNVATNEVFNAHAGSHVKFPVDGEVNDSNETIDPNVSAIKSQISNLEIENSVLKKREQQLQEEIDALKAVASENKELHEQIDTLTSQTDSFKNEIERYKNLDDLEQEHHRLQSKYNDQSEQVENLKRMLEDNEVNKSIIAEEFGEGEEIELGENDREIVALKAYLEKVLEENEKLKGLQVDLDEMKQKNVQLSKDVKSQNRLSTSDDAGKWQKKYEDLRLGKAEEYFSSPDSTVDPKLFSASGSLEASKLATVYTKIDSVMTYLRTGPFEPLKLFDMVSEFVSASNLLVKDIKSPSGINVIKLDEKKLILANAISNLLETTRHYAVYRQILPKLILDIALTDVYLVVCDIAALVKIRATGQQISNLRDITDDQVTTPIEEGHGAISQTPMALRINTRDLRDSSMNSLNSPTEKPKLDLSSVRPLKISQRLNESKNNLLGNENDTSFDRSTISLNEPVQAPQASNAQVKKGLNSPIPLQMAIVEPGIDTSPVRNNVSKEFGHVRRRDSVIDRVNKLNSSMEDQSVKKVTPVVANKSINSIKDKFENLDQKVIGSAAGGAAGAFGAIGIANEVSSVPKKVNIKALSNKLNGTLHRDDEEATQDAKPVEQEQSILDTSALDDITNKVNKSLDDVNLKGHIQEPEINFNNTPNIDQSFDFNNTPQVNLPRDAEDEEPLEVSPVKPLCVPVETPSVAIHATEKADEQADASITRSPVEATSDIADAEIANTNIEAIPAIEKVQAVDDKNHVEATLPSEEEVIANESPVDDVTHVVEKSIEKETVLSTPVQKDQEEDEKEEERTDNDTPGNALKAQPRTEEENPFIEKTLDVPIHLKELSSASPIESEFDSSMISEGKSALEIDEGLARRVSRRLSRHLSLKNGTFPQELPVDDVNDTEEEEEDFDVENFNTLNPDNTLKELLLYLEHQTVEVINAIQTTLGSIKNPKATKGLLREGANEINRVVRAMAEGTTTLMKQSRYAESMGHARYVVDVLEDCVKRMEGIYGDDTSKDGEYAGKNFKQRSAGIAFDVARSTKELVKTVEEASLMDEIAVLDSRLNPKRG